MTWVAAFSFSARQLVWLLLLAVASGVALTGPALAFTDLDHHLWLRQLRALHSASALLLVVGGLGHAAARVASTGASVRGMMSGVATAGFLGLSAVSGSMVVAAADWSAKIGVSQSDLLHAASIFHFGYSGAIAFGLTYWHARAAGRPLLPRPDPALVAMFLALLASALLQAPRPDSAAWATMVLVPMVAGFWTWSVLAPAIFLLWVPRAKQGSRNER